MQNTTLQNTTLQKRKRQPETNADNVILLANESKLVAAVADMQGKRYNMEDTHINTKLNASSQTLRIFAVCDGHGGNACSRYLQKYLAQYVSNCLCGSDPTNSERIVSQIQTAFAQCESAFEKQRKLDDDSGSTCCMMICFEKEGLYYIANCGDSRAVLLENITSTPLVGIQITTDHKPELESEKKRITAAGGKVVKIENYYDKSVIYRVNNILAVARSFGDVFLRPYITEKPDVFGPFRISKNTAILLACDGAFEVTTTAQLCGEIENIITSQSNERLTRHSTPDTRRVLAITNGICGFAFDSGSCDNITSLCVQFLQ